MIDLDANATTPLSPHARAAMQAAMQDDLGNPSSPHGRGQAARRRLEQARADVVRALGGTGGRLVWTSGATEANGLAWHGVLSACAQPHVVTSAVEHPSVLALARQVEKRGGTVTSIGVDAHGRLDLDALRAALRRPTQLVSVLAVQNELGLQYPIAELAACAHAAGALFHTDATQAPGRVAVDLQAWQVDLASVSAHKAGGPAGVGALWLRRGLPLHAVQPGHQEDGLRGGTENCLGAIGMAAAFGQLDTRLQAMPTLRALRDRLWRGLGELAAELELDIRRNGDVPGSEETGHVLNVACLGLDGARLVRALDLEGVAVSSGAACASGTQSPSHVLVACGQPPDLARAALRFSLGPALQDADIDQTLAALRRVLLRQRARMRPAATQP